VWTTANQHCRERRLPATLRSAAQEAAVAELVASRAVVEAAGREPREGVWRPRRHAAGGWSGVSLAPGETPVRYEVAVGASCLAPRRKQHVKGPRLGRSSSPRLTGAALENRASGATIAFLESDRADESGAGDPYGDIAIAPTRVLARRGSLSSSPNCER
jgi:hypothetical protein